MSETHREALRKGDAAIAAGDHEGFLAFCTDDTTWTFVGKHKLKDKEAVRRCVQSILSQVYGVLEKCSGLQRASHKQHSEYPHVQTPR